jgi:hypothetical protein
LIRSVIGTFAHCMKIIRANKRLNKIHQGYTAITLEPSPFRYTHEYDEYVKQHKLIEAYHYSWDVHFYKKNKDVLTDMHLLTMQR